MGCRVVHEPDWYARCNDCGGEVVFDAYATLEGEVWNTFEKDNICTHCDGHNVRWQKADRDQLPPTMEDD
jgi:Zn finger protein HypA/HybF involved in hydrogenase expression